MKKKPFKESNYPSIPEYVAEFNTVDSDIQLILEPGRSLIANCAILVADVVGVKASDSFDFQIGNLKLFGNRLFITFTQFFVA